jgi:very-short-patch-repair endonuclease
VYRNCQKCDAILYVPPAALRNGRGRYCSIKCSTSILHNGENNIKRLINLRKKAFDRRRGEYRKCMSCGKTKYFIPSALIGNGGRFCSVSCTAKYHTTEFKERMAKITDKSYLRKLPQRFKTGHIPWNKNRKNCWNDDIIQKIREARSKQTFLNQDTMIEKKIQEQLNLHNIRYKHPYILNHFICDFAIPEKKVIIECDGDYWHSLQRNKRYDRMKNDYCDKHGWTLLRFTEIQIHKDIQTCIRNILSIIKT